MLATGRVVILDQLRLLRPVLRGSCGRGWPWAFLRAALRARALVRRSRWQAREDEEGRAARVLAILPAFCRELRQSRGAGAEESVRHVVAGALEAAHAAAAEDAGLFRIASPVERWHAFFDRMLVRSPLVQSESECLAVEPALFHVRVARCLFSRVMHELGEPDLAELGCDAHRRFCASLLPSYDFELRRWPSPETPGAPVACDHRWQARLVPAPPPRPAADERPRGTAAAAPALTGRDRDGSGPVAC